MRFDRLDDFPPVSLIAILHTNYAAVHKTFKKVKVVKTRLCLPPPNSQVAVYINVSMWTP